MLFGNKLFVIIIFAHFFLTNNENTKINQTKKSSVLERNIHRHLLNQNFSILRTAGKTREGKGFSHKANDPHSCPDGFTYHEEQDYAKYQHLCYVLTEPQQFPPKCPYPYHLAIYEVVQMSVYKNIRSDSIWAMVRRNTSNGFGPFEWVDKGLLHGLLTYDYKRQYDDIANKNCLIIIDGIYMPVYCEEKYPAICVYPYDFASISKYCQTHYLNGDDGYTACMGDSFNIESHNCYCERTVIQQLEPGEGTREMVCDVLAEPLTSFHSHLLLYQLQTTHDACWFGLYMDEEGIFRWTVADGFINYAYWSEIPDYSKSLGAMKFIDNPGWILEDDDGGIKCGICEFKNPYNKEVTINLKYISALNSIEVRIKNPIEISDYFGQWNTIYCYCGPIWNKYTEKLISIPLQFDDKDEYVDIFKNDLNFPVYYWCEAYQHPNLTRVYSNTIFIKYNLGRLDYSITAKVRITKDTDPYLSQEYLTPAYVIRSKLMLPDHEMRTMKVLNYNQSDSSMDVIMLITTETDEPDLAQYERLDYILNNGFIGDPVILDILRFGRSDFCLPSVTQSLNWPKTKTGASTPPVELCLGRDGKPIIRKCSGDFLHGAVWSKVTGTCSDSAEISDKTKELYDLLNNGNITASELTGNVSRITEDSKHITVTDIYLISEIIQRLETFDEDVQTTEIVTIISNIMNFNLNELRESQQYLNCTDEILNSLDNILINSHFEEEEDTYQIFNSSRLLVQMNNVKATNITGVALWIDSEDFESFRLTPLYKNTSIEDILESNIELAVFLPENLIEEIENCTGEETPLKLIITMFSNDALFMETEKKERRPNSRIVSILVPSFYCSFKTPIWLVFKPLHNFQMEKGCAYWHYGLDDLMQNNIKGSWYQESVPDITNNSYMICEFSHVTHFSLLLMGSFSKDIPKRHLIALNIVTAIGSTLSVISILIIFILAVTSRKWRQHSANKIILNFSFAIILQIILLYISDNIDKDGLWCTAVGVALHYVILSEFLWMLIIAIMQYRKFVIVLTQPVIRLVAKSCIVCWCLPLFPIVILVAISKDSYQKNIHGLCYPTGYYFYFGIILPISVILITNSVVFLKIIIAICHKKVKAYGPKTGDTKLQVVLSVFLFFLLGMSWIFGLASGFGGGVTFTYLFCLTASFQGIVVLIFFVIINKKPENICLNFKSVFSRNKKRKTSTSSSSPTQITEGTDISSRRRLPSHQIYY